MDYKSSPDFESMLELYSEAFGFTRMDYKTLKQDIAHRYRLIAWLHNENGWSCGDISNNIGVSRQRVYEIVKKWPDMEQKVNAFFNVQANAYAIKMKYRDAIAEEWGKEYGQAYKEIATEKHGLSRLRMGLAWLLIERGVASPMLAAKIAGYKSGEAVRYAHSSFNDLLVQGLELPLRIKKAIDSYGIC